MDEYKQAALDAIEKNRKLIYDIADSIWSHPELSLREHYACDLYCEVLTGKGFKV